MLADRLAIAPEVAHALADGRPVVALESTLISHGLPYPANLEVATGVRGGRPRGAAPSRRPSPSTTAGCSSASTRRPRGARDRARRVGPQGRPPEPGRGAGRRRLGRDDGLGDDDRRARRRDPGLRDRRDRRRPPRRPGRARVRRRARPSTSRRTSRSSAGRRWPSCAPGPKAILDVPATLEYLETRGVPVVAVGQAELPGFYARSAGIPAPASRAGRRRRGRLVGPPPRPGPRRVRSCVCVPVPADAALPGDVARDAVERAVREAEAAGHRAGRR